MPDDNKPDIPLGKMDALIRFIHSPDEDIEAMSDVDVVAFLKEEGLDPDSRLHELRARLASIDGAERLRRARLEREASDNKIATPKPPNTWTNIRAELLRRLDSLKASNPQAAGMYARNFDKLSEADMLDMIDDLIELEDGSKDGQNDGLEH